MQPNVPTTMPPSTKPPTKILALLGLPTSPLYLHKKESDHNLEKKPIALEIASLVAIYGSKLIHSFWVSLAVPYCDS
jgi:hypothetical protein